MSQYRFSPIKSKEELFEAIEYMHYSCLEFVAKVYGKKVPIAGNVAVFCHFDDEYKFLSKFAKGLTLPSSNPNQKYFQLKKPITFDEYNYEWLYIRKPYVDSPEVGDIDFVLSVEGYKQLKAKVASGEVKDAKIFNPTGWDMIELSNSEFDVLPYISTKVMAKRARVQYSQ